MKRVIACFIIIFIAFSSFAYAEDALLDVKSSLSVQYKCDGSFCDGIEVKAYRVAEILENGEYALCDAFKEYPISIENMESQMEMDMLASTLESYIIADGIEPTKIGVTDKEGWVVMDELLLGLYLIPTVHIDNNGKKISFKRVITMAPNGEKGDVIAKPKYVLQDASRRETTYKVQKLWKNDANIDSRPKYIEVDILKNGKVESTQRLSSENNWCYKWKTFDDGSRWDVVERNVPKNYKVTIKENEHTITITNAYDFGIVKPPKTGDTSVVWPYALAMLVSGAIVLLIARGKTNEKRV